MAASRIQGIFVPNMIPFDKDGNVNEPELRRYINWLIAQGAHGLYPNGTTGEFIRFSTEERRRIIAVIVEEVAGRIPIIAGAADPSARETLRACEYYASLGVRSCAVVAPYYFKMSPDNVYAYFKEICDNSPLDITLYNIPVFASMIDVATVQRLSEECPRAVAIKDSSGDISHMQRMISKVKPNRPEFVFMTGYDPALLPMMLIGCEGGTNCSAGLAPHLTRKLYELAKGNDVAEARKVQTQVTTLFDAATGSVDFPEAVRLILELRGFKMGAGRCPLGPETHERLAMLRPELKQLLSRPEYQPIK